jgi:2-dehydro-3-deoxyphosphooctonate aldolase (KDO 8-P synthase)
MGNVKTIKFGGYEMGGGKPLVIIAGPCVIESREICERVAVEVSGICAELKLPYVFKASYDKANRSSLSSFRGLGIDEGLDILADLREKTKVPILTDVHSPEEAYDAGKVVDVLQTPAFLCRQTDLITAAAEHGRAVNIKKGQFIAPWDVGNIVEKAHSVGNENIAVCERGSSFGYNNLVVDMKAFPIIRSYGVPVVFDCTHSVQLPGGLGHASGGQREFVEPLARAAVGAGIDGLFLETHPDPDNALSDGPNMIPLDHMHAFLKRIAGLSDYVRSEMGE